MRIKDLTIKIFADGADIGAMLRLAANPLIKGFTTNPTLMHKAGITNYHAFAANVLDVITDRPVSFEVFADDLPTMEAQAHEIASWGGNVNVKIPVTNTAGIFTGPVIQRLSAAGVAVNVTALTTTRQVRNVADLLDPATPAFISVFAGRVADTGIDPVPVMVEALDVMAHRPLAELIWASPRELLNVVQADRIGCHVITVTSDILGKLDLIGKDLDDYSLETVKMFYKDACAAGFTIRTSSGSSMIADPMAAVPA
jgi:transaldolase